MTEEDVTSYYSHKSTPVMLAAKEAHKLMLKKKRAKWYELLDHSDSDDNDDSCDRSIDAINLNTRGLSLNANIDIYAKENKESKEGHGFKMSVSKQQRNKLKTNNLRKSVTRMMNLNPDKSNIWNVELN